MDIPYWIVQGGLNSNGNQLIVGIVPNSDFRDEDQRSKFLFLTFLDLFHSRLWFY
jgi:hypothetical protein